ncbi:hypothetical protein SAMN05216232_1974 [Virgibacillus subterraneus]|uniref:DUF1292 domain-containing protein n=1 Tax=Virgibacillus subterraneus TaxID=621109 RepID=A0A1H9EBS4_9BACI|nr:hypothetical protein [Virgibacillus subterraneus]SEQ23151.1 hypothetical protein SAMN05216232_1974 [Virgibacillus subterraneus]
MEMNKNAEKVKSLGNIKIVLESDYVNGSEDNFEMFFYFNNQDEIRITTINSKDNSQHDFALTKEEYQFLKEQFDKHFNS